MKTGKKWENELILLSNTNGGKPIMYWPFCKQEERCTVCWLKIDTNFTSVSEAQQKAN